MNASANNPPVIDSAKISFFPLALRVSRIDSMLILDEVQERGNTAWEDRILTHILDRRYGAMVPTIIIANLTESALVECLGDSIISRLTETGGVIEIDGPSHRLKP